MNKLTSIREKILKRPSSKLIVILLVFVGVVVLIGSSISWFLLIRNKPENIFEAMLNNNLRTASVTRTVTQDNGYQQLKQVMRVQNRTQHVAHGITTISQGSGSTTVVTESVGLPDVEYVRYNSINTTQKDSKGQALDFHNALNVWAINKPSSPDQLSSLYQDVTLGNLFLFADLNQSDRRDLMNQIKSDQVYTVDYKNAKKTWVDGRLKYNYSATMNPTAFITMLKQYGRDVGLTQLEAINPDDYKDSKKVKFTIVVDVLSQRLDSVIIGGSDKQMYSGYGIIENVNIPKDAIPASELQQRLTQSASV